jgi:hypothetical protein
MAANASPDDVRLTWTLFWPVLKGSTSVACPGHLEDAWMALHTFDP